MIYKYLIVIFFFFFFLPQTSGKFVYWENIVKEKQDSILQAEDVYSDVCKTYNGTFSPSDNNLTILLLDTLSNLPYNVEVKALYFYVFNDICLTSDGTLAEILAKPCLNILLSNSEYVIVYLQDNPKLLKRYAQILGAEFYFKRKGLSSIKYDYAAFKKIVSSKIAKKPISLKTFFHLCSEIEEVIRNMD